MLRTVDERDLEFGENQRVTCPIRCNQALIWSSDNNPGGSEIDCSYKKKHDKIKGKHVEGLLKCAEKDTGNNEASRYADHEPLVGADYESITQMNEKHLTEHLESRSHHAYGHLRNTTLHFIGL